MKFKGIEIVEAKDSDAELLCNVDFDNAEVDENLVNGLKNELLRLFRDFEKDIYIEPVLDDLILVRCWDIGFNKEGVNLLKKIYDKLSNKKFKAADVKISVGVWTGSSEYFKAEDGHEYNSDEVSWDEFIENLEY